MPEKRMPAIVDMAVWEKTTKGRAGIRRVNVFDKICKDLGGDEKEVHRSLAGTRHTKKKEYEVEERRRLALRNKAIEGNRYYEPVYMYAELYCCVADHVGRFFSRFSWSFPVTGSEGCKTVSRIHPPFLVLCTTPNLNLTLTQPNPTQPNPTQPNPTQPNPTQPNPTQP